MMQEAPQKTYDQDVILKENVGNKSFIHQMSYTNEAAYISFILPLAKQ